VDQYQAISFVFQTAIVYIDMNELEENMIREENTLKPNEQEKKEKSESLYNTFQFPYLAFD